MNRPGFLCAPLRRRSRLNHRAHQLKIHPEGRAADMVGGVVGAVDGGIGAAGDRMSVEDKG
jgi:hypothetical protein